MMHKIISSFLILFFPAAAFCQEKTISIPIEKSKYGMIFTTMNVNGKNVNTIIDFGDPNRFQLSDTLVKQLHISVKKTQKTAMMVTGEKYIVEEGIIDSLKVGETTFRNEIFSSSPNEMKNVSEEIKTEFNAVIGWGFFKNYYITLNYPKNEIVISSEKQTKKEIYFSGTINTISSYLILQGKINGIKTNLILDTGAPVSVIDSVFYFTNKISATDTTVKHLDDTLNMKIIPTTFTDREAKIPYLLYDLRAISMLATGVIGANVFSNYKIFIEPEEKLIFFCSKN